MGLRRRAVPHCLRPPAHNPSRTMPVKHRFASRRSPFLAPRRHSMKKLIPTMAMFAAALLAVGPVLAQCRAGEDRPDPADDRASRPPPAARSRRPSSCTWRRTATRSAGRKVEVIVKDDASAARRRRAAWRRNWWSTTRSTCWPASASRRSAMATAPIATQSQDADGGDGRGHLEHHRGLAVHRAHQLHAAAGGGGAWPTGRPRTASRRS